MTFELVRWGFPNTAAIVALAALPFVATLIEWQPKAATARIEAAAICPAAAECPMVATVTFPELIFE